MESGQLSIYLKVEESENSRALHPCYYKQVSKNELHMLSPPNQRHSFQFQKILMPEDSLVENLSAPLTKQVLQGSNGCLIVAGSPSPQESLFSPEGMIMSSVKHLHKELSCQRDHFVVMLSFFEAKDDKLTDLGGNNQLQEIQIDDSQGKSYICLLYTSPSPRDS